MAVDNYSLLFDILSFTSLLGKCSEVEENKQVLRILYRRCVDKIYFIRVEGKGAECGVNTRTRGGVIKRGGKLT